MYKQAAIAIEHRMPFPQVVRLYAEAGHSMSDTALIIGYSPGAFIRLCDRRGWRPWFKTGQEAIAAKQARADRRGACSEGQKRATRAASAVNPTYLAIEHQGRLDTLTGHARRVGLSVRTVRNRWYRRPGDVDYALATRAHPNGSGCQHAMKRVIRQECGR